MSRGTERSPLGRISCLRICYIFLYVVMVAAGESPAGSGFDNTHLSNDILTPSSLSFSRTLSQEEVAPDSQFAGVDRCPELDAILTATPAASSRFGNFTEIPDPSVIRDCSSSSSSYLLDGETLAEALAEPTPLLKGACSHCDPVSQDISRDIHKRVILETSDPIVWPVGRSAMDLAPGSVNMIDCQNGVLDLRNRNFGMETQFGTILYYRCNVIFPDMHQVWTTTTYLYDATGIFPCNGTSELSRAGDYPRSAPGQFPVLTANLAPDKEFHTRNYSVWCWDEDDIRDLYQCCAGVVLLLCAIGLAVWLCLGRPCWSFQSKQAHTPKHTNRYLDDRGLRMAGEGPSSLHYRSTEELAAALTSVLTSHRVGSDGRGNATAHTHSSRTSGHQEGGLRAPHECKDCGRPFSRGGTNSLLHVQSGSRTASTPDERQCPNCWAHGGSGGEASDYYDDLAVPPRAYPGTSRARYKPRDPRTRLAGPVHVGMRSNMATDAWVEDSLEARARVAGDVRLGPGRERFSDVDTMSLDERRSGSINFAPPRRVNDSSSRVNVLDSFTRRSGDAPAERTGPASPLSQYQDAQDAQAPNRSANSSASLPTRRHVVETTALTGGLQAGVSGARQGAPGTRV